MAGMVTVAWREQMVYRAECPLLKRSSCIAAHTPCELHFLQAPVLA